MKKNLIVLAIMLSCMGAKAQSIQGIKDFLGTCKYEFVIGFGTTGANKPFAENKIIYNIGVTGRKEVTTLMDDKLGVYGLAGLIMTKRGGKHDNNALTLIDEDLNIGVTSFSIPLHAGVEYKFNKTSLFIDLGPNLLLPMGNGNTDNLSTSVVTIGGGINFGIRFKKFALSYGIDQDFTNFATMNPNDRQCDALGLPSGNKLNLKTSEAHINLRWTFGK